MRNATDYHGMSFLNADHLKWIYLSSEGRLNRMRYWAAAFLLVPIIAVWFGMSFILLAAGSFAATIGGILLAVGYIFLAITSIVLLIKRAHDRDHSGWYILLTWIPLIGWIFSIELVFFAGTYGRNQYGEDPRPH